MRPLQLLHNAPLAAGPAAKYLQLLLLLSGEPAHLSRGCVWEGSGAVLFGAGERGEVQVLPGGHLVVSAGGPADPFGASTCYGFIELRSEKYRKNVLKLYFTIIILACWRSVYIPVCTRSEGSPRSPATSS